MRIDPPASDEQVLGLRIRYAVMDEEAENEHESELDDWEPSGRDAVDLVGTVSKALFIGAGLALVLGILGAVATFSGHSSVSAFEAGAATAVQRNSFAISQMSSQLVDCLLPAGLLLAAGMALRVQAGRLDAKR